MLVKDTEKENTFIFKVTDSTKIPYTPILKYILCIRCMLLMEIKPNF